MNGIRFKDYHAEQMKDPKFRKEWEALQPEYEKELDRLMAELMDDDYVEELLKDPERRKVWEMDKEANEAHLAALRAEYLAKHQPKLQKAEIMAEEAHQPMMHRPAKRAQMAG